MLPSSPTPLVPDPPEPAARPRGRADLRLVVFDWDGTLMDSIGTIVECTLAAVADVPGVVAPPAETIRHSIGLGLHETMERFFPGGDPALFERVIEAYRNRWLAEYKGRAALIPGAREAVVRVREAGYLVAVATAKSRAGLDRELGQTGLAAVVDASRTVTEAPSKPDPGMLLQIFGELEVAAHQAVMVGDTAWDLEMARNAGSHSIGVLSGGHSREQLAPLASLACLDSVATLPGWLTGTPPS